MAFFNSFIVQNIKLIVQEEYLEPVRELLLHSGFESIPQPGESYPDFRYLDAPVYRLRARDAEIVSLLKIGSLPSIIDLTSDSIGDSFFKNQDLRSFANVGGMLVPPLPTLAYSFLRAYFKIKTDVKYKLPRYGTEDLLNVWVSYVKHRGYTPLGTMGMNAPGFEADEPAKKLWAES
jgi:hypothetical protein